MKYLNTSSGYIPPAPYKVAFFLPKPPPPPYDRWGILRKQVADLPVEVNLRLEWIIFYETVGKRNVVLTAKHFGISRKTFHKWRQRFEKGRGDVRCLLDLSKAPRHRRSWQVTLTEEERIIRLRKLYLKYGKRKLKVLYQARYGQVISTWKVERVIRRHQLYPDKETYRRRLKIRRQNKRKDKVRIQEVGRSETFGHLWHIDTIILWWYGQKRIIFTALEELTKIGYARIYTTNSSGFAEDFLKRLRFLVEGRIQFLHSDNGSEFEGEFEQACLTLGIQQVYSRPHTPKDNPALERFNWTVQDEWLSLSEIGLNEIASANQDLTNWLVEYNAYRPHQSLDYQTPLGYAESTFFSNSKVLPMWSARTVG